MLLPLSDGFIGPAFLVSFGGNPAATMGRSSRADPVAKPHRNVSSGMFARPSMKRGQSPADGDCPLSDHPRTPNRVGIPGLSLVASETLGDLDTDGSWAIGNFSGRLSAALAVDNQITVLIEHILNKQCQIQIHFVIFKAGPGIKD